MTCESSPDPASQDHLNQVLLRYLEAIQAGLNPEKEQILANHPELKNELKEFFDCYREVEQLAGQLRPLPTQSDAPLQSRFSPAIPSNDSILSVEGPAAIQSPDVPPEETVQSSLGQLGDFQLLREIGRGGMGVVYEADQISLRRRVALKILPFAAAIDSRQLQRFQNEALAAAHLRHPHIVPVYAVGSDRGVHFYAMQFIDGQSLAALIGELRKTDDTSDPSPHANPQGQRSIPRTSPSAQTLKSGRLSPSASRSSPSGAIWPTATSTVVSLSQNRNTGNRNYFLGVASLCRQAALGLEHAHLMGVVHRDIKPANLLLDSHGQIWITDFGLALMANDVALTLSGEMLGTLRYASPEQALGQRRLVDHRCDIYSLGATLYELLTLKPIFEGHDRHEILAQIRDSEPVLPRLINRTIPAELETIVLKALAKDPADRYSSAQEFADDLERFCENRPVLARRPSILEKATRWAWRHRTVVTSIMAALLLTSAALATATALTTYAYEREKLKAQEADEQRHRAEQSFRQAWGAVDRFAQIAEEELAGQPQLETLRRRFLDVALTYYQDLIDQREDDPGIQQELEVSRARAEKIHGELATLIGAARYFPLNMKMVQDDLGLTPDQRETLAQIDRRWREGLQESLGLTADVWERRRLALAREQESAIPRLLTPDQMNRFNQISLQLAGPFAFSMSRVQEMLQLTTDQKTGIKRILDSAKMPGPGGPGGPGPRPHEGGPSPGGVGSGWGAGKGLPGEGKRREEIRKRQMDETLEKVLVLLTEDQKKAWKELIGRPFVGNHGSFPPPPFSGK